MRFSLKTLTKVSARTIHWALAMLAIVVFQKIINTLICGFFPLYVIICSIPKDDYRTQANSGLSFD